jgi:hypothetical protein
MTRADGLTMISLLFIIGLGVSVIALITIDGILADKWPWYSRKMYGKYLRRELFTEYDEGKVMAAVGVLLILLPVVIITAHMFLMDRTLTDLAHHQVAYLWR